MKYLWTGLILLYIVFLSLPWVTDVGYVYLKNTSIKAKADMEHVAQELRDFYGLYNRYPDSPASHFISDASLAGTGKTIYLFSPQSQSSILFDPFIADGYTQPYRYYTDGQSWFVLACNGPDQDIDVDETVLQTIKSPTYNQLAGYIYHASQGNRSGGDVIVIGP